MFLALVLLCAVPLTVSAQECTSFQNPTVEDLQALSGELNTALLLEQQRRDAAYRQLSTQTDVAANKMWDVTVGLFLERTEDYDTLLRTLNEADIAFRSGQITFAVSRTRSLFDQAKTTMTRVTGILNPDPYLAIPKTPEEATEFIKNANETVQQYGRDWYGLWSSLGQLGNAMEVLENSSLAQVSLRQQIAETERCMGYAPHRSPSSVRAAASPQSGAPSQSAATAVCDHGPRFQKCFADLNSCQNSCYAAYFNASLTAYKDCMEGPCSKQNDACLDWASRCD